MPKVLGHVPSFLSSIEACVREKHIQSPLPLFSREDHLLVIKGSQTYSYMFLMEIELLLD